MPKDITPEEIKEIRGRYGLSQKGFARLLGLGDASIVRYENGQRPTRANANLIRAAAIPEFVAGCLERDGEELTEAQRGQVEKVVYAEMRLNEEGEMDINEIYEFTLQREVLTEKAWGMTGDLVRLRMAAQEEGDEGLALIYEDMLRQVALLKPRILECSDGDKGALAVIDGQLDCMRRLCTAEYRMAA